VQEGHPKLAATGAIVSTPEPLQAASPRKVLILSGEMGEGHNAAAAAITEAIADVWPDCQVERFDTLELWGRGFSHFMSRGYEIQIRRLPLTYEVFYDALCASRGFAALSKLAIGSFFGRRLKTFLTTHDADLVISVYPFGSAALHWLRTRHSYKVPSVTYVPAFHVHPVWAYAGIDQHYVMYESAPDHAQTAGFERTMRVGAPPVRDGFGTVSKMEARERLGLDQDKFILLTTGGAWGLGGIDEAVQALSSSDIERLQVIAVCGRSTKLLHHLQSMGIPHERLLPYGYVSNMHEIMAAADVVVTNGAGVTVLEALRTPRPCIAFKPLAGHGKASTDEMMTRDLALVAHDVAELVTVTRELATDQVLMARMEHAGREWCKGRELRDSVRAMNELFPAAQASPGAHP
jgi:diacylglycerol O-acyltransferase / wax synthase